MNKNDCFSADFRSLILIHDARVKGTISDRDRILFTLILHLLVKLFVDKTRPACLRERMINAIQVLLSPSMYVKKRSGRLSEAAPPFLSVFADAYLGSRMFVIGNRFVQLMAQISLKVSPICDCRQFLGPVRFEDVVNRRCECSILKPTSKFNLRHFKETSKGILPLEKFDHSGYWEPDELDERIHLILKTHRDRQHMTLQQLTKHVFLSQEGAPDRSTLDRTLRELAEFERQNPQFLESCPKQPLFRGIEIPLYYP